MKALRHLLLWLFAFFGVGEGPVGAAELLFAPRQMAIVAGEHGGLVELRSDAAAAADLQAGAPSEPDLPLFPTESEGSGLSGKPGPGWNCHRKPALGVVRPGPGELLATVAGFRPRAPPAA